MRVVSLVPGATETLCALGLRSTLVGVSHECVRVVDLAGLDVKVVSRTRLPAGAPGSVIDGAVKTAHANKNELNVLDMRVLAELSPDVVVAPAEPPGSRSPCVIPAADVHRALAGMDPQPRLLVHGPTSFAQLFGSMRAIGEALDRGAESARFVAELRTRVEAVKGSVSLAHERPRVALLSWVNPPIGAGGLLAEMVRLAGGRPVVGDPAEPARPLDWAHVVGVSPQVLVIAPCGFTLDRSRDEAEGLRRVAGLLDTPAGRFGQVHAADGLRHFSTAGPGLVRGLELLATLVHPELPWPEHLLPGALCRPIPLD